MILGYMSLMIRDVSLGCVSSTKGTHSTSYHIGSKTIHDCLSYVLKKLRACGRHPIRGAEMIEAI